MEHTILTHHPEVELRDRTAYIYLEAFWRQNLKKRFYDWNSWQAGVFAELSMSGYAVIRPVMAGSLLLSEFLALE